MDSAEAIANDLQTEFEVIVTVEYILWSGIHAVQEWTAKALAYCPRVENPRKPDEVERQLHSLNSALKSRAQEYAYHHCHNT